MADQLVLTSFHDEGRVLQVTLNRPAKVNAFSMPLFAALGAVFKRLRLALLHPDADEADPLAAVRCVVLNGNGRGFSSGIDIKALAGAGAQASRGDGARTALRMRHVIGELQEPLDLIAECPVPVIAATHGVCYGAGIDVIAACDIRLGSAAAKYSVLEVHVGLAADLGTLQRLPTIVGSHSVVREWCLTAKIFGADEALRHGLVSAVHADAAAVLAAAHAMAAVIASKSPVAVLATKEALNFNERDRQRRGLQNMQLLNAALLQTDDLQEAVTAKKGETVVFSKL
jgi:delta(3,5)-delta(2,4)-dienoyl-CoA isomerase